MKKNTRKHTTVMIAVLLNVALVFCVLMSVISAFNEAEAVSFSQNIENAHTLTNASANKVELEFLHHTQEICSAADYVNHYQNEGMTEDELRAFFDAFYSNNKDAYTWELVDSELNDVAGTGNGFRAISLSYPEEKAFTYKSQAYQKLAKIFHTASEETLGEVFYTSEFTDASASLAKVSAVTTTIRLRTEDGYQYKTLMMLLNSSLINDLIEDNNNIDTLDFFDFSNIIIDDDGNYVISNSQFQGTNLIHYMELYNDDFTKDDAEALQAKLHQEDYTETLYYKNSRQQDCAYTIVPVQNSDWHVLSMIPLDSFRSSYNFTHSFLTFALFFGALFFTDIVFVAIINRQLRHKTQEAQAANFAKSEFLSSMSHDIRTPMNAIIGMTLIADENLKETEPDIGSLKDCVKTIQISGNHLLTLINDVLDISKIENGKVTLVFDDFSISESIEKMLEIVQPQVKEKNFTFETHIRSVNHEFVHADELRINQVYMNILSNAIKYTNPGGKITMDFIEEAIRDCSDRVRFIYRVSDTGIGMAPEFLKTIFDRFSRAVDTRVNTTQGTGLGMSISKQLVELMGGTITVQSELNVGSVFTVTLELPVADVQVEQIPLEGLQVLLIDDDPILLETAELALHKAGITTMVASQGEKGIQLAQQFQNEGKPFDVILVDWKMSGMDGLHVARALRNILGKETKIVVMTAYNIVDIEQEARACGVNGFITKPLFQSKLRHTLQSLYTQKRDLSVNNQFPLYDLHVLVAEDNNTNWKVLNKLLNRYGIRVDRAENGEAAVEAVKNNEDYDLILMDIQMPVMNGYEATLAIRSLTDRQKAAIPIYAMTADTFAEDVKKCLACGMDGHLSKPIEMEKLLKVLALINTQHMAQLSETGNNHHKEGNCL